MILIGLGTNQGDRLTHLRIAYQHIAKIPQTTVLSTAQIYESQAMLPENADSSWDIPYLNTAVSIETRLSPQEVLTALKHIESKMGRKPTARWAPRVIDLDLLLWHNHLSNHDNLCIPHPGIAHRPFVIWPMADLIPGHTIIPGIQKTCHELCQTLGNRYDTNQPLDTRPILARLDRPQVMGVINITPDSFSDGGQFTTQEQVTKRFIELAEYGADVIDIGAESTSQGIWQNHTQTNSQNTEWLRLKDALQSIQNLKKDSRTSLPPVSIDTRHAKTAENVLTLGANWINDVTGFDDPKMVDLMLKSNAKMVVMHHLGVPPTKTRIVPINHDVTHEVLEWFHHKIEQLQSHGVRRDRLIIDVGIGFGKNAHQSWDLITQIQKFKIFGLPLLIGHSRKSFLNNLTGQPPAGRDMETLAISSFLLDQGVEYLRVHDVKHHITFLNALASAKARCCASSPDHLTPNEHTASIIRKAKSTL